MGIPSVRPLAVWTVNAAADVYQAESGSTPEFVDHTILHVLVLCGRSNLMMSRGCRVLFEAAFERLPQDADLELRIPEGGQDGGLHGMSFAELANRIDAMVLVPWSLDVTTFLESYNMELPLFVPDPLWHARLWPKQVSTYAALDPDLHRQMHRFPHGAAAGEDRDVGEYPSPYPSLQRFDTDFASMYYWAKHFAFISSPLYPGLEVFVSIPSLVRGLASRRHNLRKMRAQMSRANRRAASEVSGFWLKIVTVLLEMSSMTTEDEIEVREA